MLSEPRATVVQSARRLAAESTGRKWKPSRSIFCHLETCPGFSGRGGTEFEAEWSQSSASLHVACCTIREAMKSWHWRTSVYGVMTQRTKVSELGRFNDRWSMYVLVNILRFYSGTPYAVCVCEWVSEWVSEFHVALHCNIVRYWVRCVIGPAVCCSSFFTLIEYCNSLQSNAIRSNSGTRSTACRVV
jgi:hypothetical protein